MFECAIKTFDVLKQEEVRLHFNNYIDVTLRQLTVLSVATFVLTCNGEVRAWWATDEAN